MYVALGAGLVDFDNAAFDRCTPDRGCMHEGAAVASYSGLAASGGVGVRVPLSDRLWVEPRLSALVWDEVLPQARIGLGWRVR